MIRTIVCLCILGSVFGQVPGKGKCPEVNVKQDFDVLKYTGRWYEINRYFAVFQLFSDCVTAEYTLLDGGGVQVNNTGYDALSKKYVTAIGDAIQTDPTTASKLGVIFPGAPARGKYWVLDTDYDNYTVVWSCSDQSILGYYYNTQNTWILSRTPEGIDKNTEDMINDMLKNYNIAPFGRKTRQTGCLGRSM